MKSAPALEPAITFYTKVLPVHVVQKFTKWYNSKRQRQHRLGHMNEIRELIYRSGLARMRVS